MRTYVVLTGAAIVLAFAGFFLLPIAVGFGFWILALLVGGAAYMNYRSRHVARGIKPNIHQKKSAP